MSLRKSLLSYQQANQFSRLFLDYAGGRLREFYAFEPTPEGIDAFCQRHTYADLDRKLLVEELQAQNSALHLSAQSRENILSLGSKNTFTITTGHQLCLATGPLYFIYKILAVIRIAGELNAKASGRHFVPVYWMASEDHDVAEINHLVLFNRKYEWSTEQKGRVGEFDTAGIVDLLREIKAVLGENAAAGHIFAILERAYSEKNLGDATRYLANELFGKYGLVVVDGNTKVFKQLFREELKRDALAHFAFTAVEETSEKLRKSGYSPQVTPREINTFYAGPGMRERLVKEDAKWKVLNTDRAFTAGELENKIETETEKFSPNVVLRPLYQQKILPNAVYVGGPGEVAYWLQYRKMFDEANIPYPVLVPRNFIVYIESGLQQRMQKLGLKAEDFFTDKQQLLKRYALQQQPFDLEKEKQWLRDLFHEAKTRIGHIDKTLEGATEAELQKATRGLEALEQKTIRAIRQKSEQALNQVEAIYGRLFPGGQPQERVENFLRFYITNPLFIDEVLQALTPFSAAVEILEEREPLTN